MRASTQYNDFIGTAAADISDHTNLNSFLESRGVSLEKYKPIGATFYHSGSFSATIVCIDIVQSVIGKPYLVKINFELQVTHEEFFNLFKRFSVEITSKAKGFQNHEIDEEIMFDDRK